VTADTGLVVEPSPAAVAAAIGSLAADRALAERLGQRAETVAARMTWAAAVEKLVV
jgi:hypothetical protein